MRVKDVNYMGKKIISSVILQVLLRQLQQKPERELLKFRVVFETVNPKKFTVY